MEANSSMNRSAFLFLTTRHSFCNILHVGVLVTAQVFGLSGIFFFCRIIHVTGFAPIRNLYAVSWVLNHII